MSTIDAFHLPGLDDADVARWHAFDAGAHTLRVPLLTPDGMQRCTERLRGAQAALAAVAVDDVIGAIDRVARRLLDDRDELRALADAALPPLTGYSPAMCREIVERMAHDWTRAALERTVHAELGDAAILDGFVERGQRQLMAVSPRIVTHVFAGNIPGVAVTSLVRALLVRAASLGKTASGEPLLAPLFAQAVAREHATLGDALAVTYWPGGDRAIEEPAFAAADAIVVYGGRDALAAVRRRAPAHARVLDHGPRLSVGFVARTALHDAHATARVAADVALAVATFDQQGCVSPHAVFVEDGATDPRALAAAVARELAALEQRLPRGRLTPGEAAAIREVHARAEFAEGLELLSSPDAAFTVVYAESAAFEPSCLQRTLTIHRVATLAAALPALAPHRALLQSAAVAGDEAFAVQLAQAGFTRVTSFRRIPWPDPAEHHDGRGPLTELLDFVERVL